MDSHSSHSADNGSGPGTIPDDPFALLAATRREYGQDRLREVPATPYELFVRWYREAGADPGIVEPNAMVVATADADGPDARIVLLKGFAPDGFVFYTNYLSAKGRQLTADPRAALTFPWHPVQRQVRVRGVVEQVTAAESDTYFLSRDEGARLGAWASKQSEPIADRATLEARLEALAAEPRFREGVGERPPHWGGYRVRPTTIEFWQGGAHRLHDRFVFRAGVDEASLAEAADWSATRLQP
ncbi:pyridoxamine 5'-phosphate oxidase [Brevibacterium litoralis]|uniref:pyridoxamine 5'-phosphate oxidase n=1 Tax=Brevibacterium litoralis TaxID=3138935 RepID=UPI0032F05298